jgi:hypothetical protein
MALGISPWLIAARRSLPWGLKKPRPAKGDEGNQNAIAPNASPELFSIGRVSLPLWLRWAKYRYNNARSSKQSLTSR